MGFLMKFPSWEAGDRSMAKVMELTTHLPCASAPPNRAAPYLLSVYCKFSERIRICAERIRSCTLAWRAVAKRAEHPALIAASHHLERQNGRSSTFGKLGIGAWDFI